MLERRDGMADTKYILVKDANFFFLLIINHYFAPFLFKTRLQFNVANL